MQQSSAVMTGRLFAIMAFMVAISLLAMFGKSLPDRARALLMDQLGEKAAKTPPLAEAPRFRPAPAGVPPVAAAIGNLPPPQEGDREMGPRSSPALAEGPSQRESVLPRRLPQLDDTVPQAVPQAQVPSREAIPVSFQAPVEPGGGSLHQLQQRLRQLGAVSYRLETWGNDGGLFRFSCSVAVAGNLECTKQFESTDPDALRAMTRVVGEIEAWIGMR